MGNGPKETAGIHGITMSENKYAEYVVIVARLVNEPLPFPSLIPHPVTLKQKKI